MKLFNTFLLNIKRLNYDVKLQQPPLNDYIYVTPSMLSTQYALGGLVVSVLATGPTGYSVAGSNPTEDGGFLCIIKILSEGK
jgi:hypothetical protein